MARLAEKVWIRTIFSYVIVVAMALLQTVNYHIFIVANNFAPAGINGIATMLQYKTGFSISYMSLIVNLPLCALAFFFISKKYAVRTVTFTLIYSFTYLYAQKLDLGAYIYDAKGHDTIFPAIISGVLAGVIAGLCLRNESASGGMEIISRYVHKVNPNANFFLVNFVMNAVVAITSLFVYSNGEKLDYKPVALCITYCFVSNIVGNYIIKGPKVAYKFTVITVYPDEIINEITHILRRGATRIDGRGAYTGTEKAVLICVINKHQIADFKRILDKYDNTFSFYETTNETYGNFNNKNLTSIPLETKLQKT